jgi:transposase
MSGFIEIEDRNQATLFSERLDDYVAEDTNTGISTGCSPSRRLEVEAQRNVELMWLTGRLAPDFKTIAHFRKDNGEAIRLVCREL